MRCDTVIRHHPDCRKLPGFASKQWWATLRGVHRVLVVMKELSQKLQFGGLMLNQQREVLVKTVKALVAMGSLLSADNSREDAGDRRVGAYLMRPPRVVDNALQVSPAFARGLKTLDTREQCLAVAGAVGACVVTITAYIHIMVQEYDKVRMPGVDPKSFATMSRDDFVELVTSREGQLRVWKKGDSYTSYEERLLTEFDAFAGTTTVEGLWKTVTLKNHRKKEVPVLFRDMWSQWRPDFPLLCEFAGMFASAYPGTTQVERHFSVLRFLYNKCRRSLSPLALEGCFHCRQFWRLVSLATRISTAPIVDTQRLRIVADDTVDAGMRGLR
eukprot:GHVU01138487.1.p1 GENE.GHVU01138487.1~~GHVU01138487.1.p1  ORF type:complete len:329 (-),score=38.71 GHVU01138487.1:1084-2070(-)